MFASRAQAGPLNPPAGPITSTGKTLTDVEPRTALSATNTPGDATSVFRITQPGSYYLTGNVLGASGKSGIVIEASNVTLDLNGFSVIGVAGADRGIVTVGVIDNHTIRNGTVADWPNAGIEMTFGSNVNRCRIEDIIAANNGGNGIGASNSAILTRCISQGNGGNGFIMPFTAVVSDCLSRQNVGSGFSFGNACTVTNCSARDNDLGGFAGGSACSLIGCSARGNGGIGFSISTNSVATQCTATNNGSIGFLMGFRGQITQCGSSGNGSHGIQTATECSVRDCNCAANGAGSGGAGVRVAGGDCLVEACLCVGNDIGVQVTSPGSFLARNRCSGNTTHNWYIVAGTICLVVNAATSGAFTGNAGGTAPGSTDPNANFTF
jgi:hypothetical protein